MKLKNLEIEISKLEVELFKDFLNIDLKDFLVIKKERFFIKTKDIKLINNFKWKIKTTDIIEYYYFEYKPEEKKFWDVLYDSFFFKKLNKYQNFHLNIITYPFLWVDYPIKISFKYKSKNPLIFNYDFLNKKSLDEIYFTYISMMQFINDLSKENIKNKELLENHYKKLSELKKLFKGKA